MPGPDTLTLSLTIAADDTSVRGGLGQVTAWAAEAPLPKGQIGKLETVLAEVLNNVVEHAYVGRGDGTIRLHLAILDDGIDVAVIDQGTAMSGGGLPDGQLVNDPEELEVEDLPEGGFGWVLIHHLTRVLSYRREGSENVLRFQVPWDAADNP